MTNKWTDVSEILTGLIITNKICSSVEPSIFQPPYDDIIKSIHKDHSSIEDLVELYGVTTIQSAIHAAESINGLGKMADWPTILQKSFLKYQAGVKFEKMGRKLQGGDDIDLDDVRNCVDGMSSAEKSQLVPANELKQDYVPFMKSGTPCIDKHFAGLPQVGLIVIGAKTYTGKTTYAIQLAGNFLKQHPKKRVAFFTLEMMGSEWLERAKSIFPSENESFWSRFLIQEAVAGINEIINECARQENLGMVVIDYIDYLVEDQSMEAYTKVYLRASIGAKNLNVPVLLLAQLSGNYQGGLPRPQHLYFTRLSEGLAWEIQMLYNPNDDWFAEKDESVLPTVEGRAYILAWKIKAGFRAHPEDNRGAIMVPWAGKTGFDLSEAGRWFSLRKCNNDDEYVDKKKRKVVNK